MTVTLRNISGVAREVAGRQVEPDELLDVAGVLAADDQQPADAHVIDDGVQARAWPHAHWADETPASSRTSTRSKR